MIFFTLILHCVCTYAIETTDVVIVILSQANKYHLDLAENLKNDLWLQAESMSMVHPVVHLSHLDFPHVGGWTVIPLIPRLADIHRKNSSWIFFVEDNTKIRLKQLLETLNNYDANEKSWIGYALLDAEPTIIHHFATHEKKYTFKYPNFASGVAISTNLLLSLEERIAQDNEPTSDFNIDKAYELALFVWEKGRGYLLRHDSALCVTDGLGCATFPEPFTSCGNIQSKDVIYFAVKTCEKFHGNRINVVKETWGKVPTKIVFFSDVEDNSIPTVSLGIPNSEQGHCVKTVAILKHIAQYIENRHEIKWIVLVDDDTILSVNRLLELLTCYNDSTPVALGERYGYNVYNPLGFNYITGGGGMVFSRTMLDQLVRPSICVCPSISTPDDMYLGHCIVNLGVEITHSHLFHQARPIDYSPDFLKSKYVVSFHKHWMVDPINIYNSWFAEDDLKAMESSNIHNEL